MTVRIVELTAYQVCIPLRRPIRHASHRRTETDNIVVRCVLDCGVEGYGEGAPREYVTGETVESALALLRTSDLQSQLETCTGFADAVALAERLRLAPVPDDDRGCRGNAARCALELAVLDAVGKHFQQPLGSVAQLLAPTIFEPKNSVRYSGAITSARGLKARIAAWAMRIYGFHQVKVKVGIDGYDDPARLRVIRRILGARADLRVDANEAWSPADAAERIRALEPFGISSVEQPVPHAAASHLKELRSCVQTPVMLDESLCSMVDAERAVAGEWCDLFNLRLSKCGGFIPTLRLAQFAERNGLACQLGCQVGETAILTAAGRHFAASIRGLRYLEGSYDRHLVREALGTSDLTFRWGGRASSLPGPGLGATIDGDALARVMVRKERLL
jgi:L-alanine-DL-glutamate epimerase-like enolase superfamily enzyme